MSSTVIVWCRKNALKLWSWFFLSTIFIFGLLFFVEWRQDKNLASLLDDTNFSYNSVVPPRYKWVDKTPIPDSWKLFNRVVYVEIDSVPDEQTFREMRTAFIHSKYLNAIKFGVFSKRVSRSFSSYTYCSIEVLDLRNVAFSDEDIELVLCFPNLKRLMLSSTNVSDEGLKKLTPLKRLSILEVENSKVTGQSLIFLVREGVPLQFVDIGEGQFKPDVLDALNHQVFFK